MNKILNKLIAVMIVILLMGTNLIFLATESIATSSAYDSQNSRTNNSNVEFNSYFEGGVHETSLDMTSKEGKLYLNLNVQNAGYLKNVLVSFEGINFTINPDEKNEYIQKVDRENNQISLNQINKGNNFTIEIPLEFLSKEDVTADYLNKEFKTILTAEYVDNDGNSKTIEKTVLNKLTWTAETELENTMIINKYIPYTQGEKYGVLLQMRVNNKVKENKLPVKSSQTTITVPELSGTKPTAVSVIANNTKATNGQEDGINFNNNNYVYDAENNTLTINVENTADANSMIKWKKDSTDEFLVTFIYEGREIYNKVVEEQNKAREEKEITNRSEIDRNAVVNEESANANTITNEEIANTVTEEGTNNVVTNTESTETSAPVAEDLKINTNIKVENKLYTFDEQVISKDFAYENELKEKIGELTTTEISATNEISKGYIYANYDIDKDENKNETLYNIKYTANVDSVNIVDSVVFTQNVDRFKTEEKEGEQAAEGATTIGDKNYTYNKEVKISKTIFDKILGEDGKIEVFDNANNKLGEINKDTELNSSNEYAIDISEFNKNQIAVRTSKPIVEGKIEINITKAIAKNIDYSKEQMKEFKTIETSVIGNTIENSTEKTAKINMIEPSTKATISINKEQLSTVTENNNVEIRATLDTSSTYNSLFKDPTLKIELPEVVENVEVNSIKALYNDELKIKEATLSEENGKKVINIGMEGTQTEYSTENADIKGTSVIVDTNLELNKLGTSQDAEIKMNYTNSANAENEEEVEQKEVKTDIPIIAPTGVIATNEVSNYKEGAEDILTIEDKPTELTVDTYSDARDVVFGGQVINNYENAISNVVVVGRFPAQGNKNVDTNADLASNMTMSLKSGIQISGDKTSNIKVYYSANADATNDLSNAGNGWTEDTSNLTQMKSYLIVVENAELAAGEGFEFTYTAELAGNLTHNNSTSTMYKVFYNNISDIGTMAETKVSPIIKLTTGAGPELEVTLSSSLPEGTILKDGQYLRMYVTVKNIGDMDAENAKVEVQIPDGSYHAIFEERNNMYKVDEDARTLTMELGNIKVGETIQTDYDLLVNAGATDTSDSTEIKNNVLLTADNLTGSIKSNDYTFKISFTGFTVFNSTNTVEYEVYKPGQIIQYRIRLGNSTGNDLSSVTVNIPLPNDVEVENSYIESDNGNISVSVEENSKNATIDVGTMVSGDVKDIVFEFKIGEETDSKFSTMITANVGELGEHYSNERWIYTGSTSLTGKQLEPSKEYVKEDERFEYKFEIVTKGNASTTNVILEDELPAELTLRGAEFTAISSDGTETNPAGTTRMEDGKLYVTVLTVPANSTLTITLKVSGRLESESDDGKELINKAYIYADGIDRVELNSTTVYLEYDSKLHDNPSESGENRYRISGTAWLDNNQNGMRDEDETTMPGIQVALLYKSNGQLVTDANSGENKIVTTGENGKYEFTNLTPNEYLVIFLYDAGSYSITTYQKDGVDSNKNSDAIETNITLNGARQIAGVTDTLQVVNENLRNIDLGLYQDKKFDLSLQKYVTKISLTTPTIGTAQYEYGDSTLEKVEILGQNAGKSSMVIEYKIVIKNEGGVAGYARKIVDYLPEDVGFSTDLNKDWYLSETNGDIYNTSLENTLIQPGETKELTLILTKQITEDSIGTTLNNQAEIYETYNEQGLKDIDSTEANRQEGEDDLGQADVLISLVTGKIIMYTGLIILVLAIITTGVIVIKKKVLAKNK